MSNSIVVYKPGMACVGQIVKLSPILRADRILRAEVDCGNLGCWSGVVQNTLHLADKVFVFIHDAILPQDERWTFMEKHNWRVKMCRFKGCPSEVLIVGGAPDYELGYDLTKELGVYKYEKVLPANMAGEFANVFPYFIPKTDEENFQKIPGAGSLMKKSWYATLKYDGTSCTVYKDKENELHVCSRSMELKRSEDNVYWKTALKFGFKFIDQGYGVQFEIVGPGIQGNPLGLLTPEPRIFTIWGIENRKRVSVEDLDCLLASWGLLQWRCETIGIGSSLTYSDDDLRKLADQKYPNGVPAEGVVVRAMDSSFSFKVLNLNYKN